MEFFSMIHKCTTLFFLFYIIFNSVTLASRDYLIIRRASRDYLTIRGTHHKLKTILLPSIPEGMPYHCTKRRFSNVPCYLVIRYIFFLLQESWTHVPTHTTPCPWPAEQQLETVILFLYRWYISSEATLTSFIHDHL